MSSESVTGWTVGWIESVPNTAFVPISRIIGGGRDSSGTPGLGYERGYQNMFIIQAISTDWTKASRGGSNAARRNNVPEQIPIPTGLGAVSAHSLVFHQVKYTEDDDFLEPRLNRVEVQAMPEEGSRYNNFLVVRPSDGTLRVVCEWGNVPGAPKRYPTCTETVLQPDQWMRVRYNIRRSRGEEQWIYEKWVFNVAIPATLSPRIFLDNEPSKVQSEMADLW